jgi:multidrug efflux pump subunit AcrA (membrane-fusion protein)
MEVPERREMRCGLTDPGAAATVVEKVGDRPDGLSNRARCVMIVRQGFIVLGCLLMRAAASLAQALPTTASIETVPLELTMPERYQVTAVLEPIRRVTLMAPADGVVRGIEAPLGTAVRPTQEIAQLDRGEALSRVKLAQAHVKEKQALVKTAQTSDAREVFGAQVEAAQARVELAQMELDRLTLQAPFAGRIVAVPASSGQFVLKGTVIAELADVSSMKALVPVDRGVVTQGADVKVFVEEQEQTAKVQSILPLPESHASLRELAAPFAAAWITVPNPKGALAAGLRVRSATLPITPIATVPKDAVKPADGGAGAHGQIVQVIRNDYVTNVPVQVLGKVGPERVQITGVLRTTDALIASSSVPLLPGTLVRFSHATAPEVEGTTPSPNPQGSAAGITPPARAGSAAPATGAPGAARTSRPAAPGRSTRRSPTPTAGQGQGSTPF